MSLPRRVNAFVAPGDVLSSVEVTNFPTTQLVDAKNAQTVLFASISVSSAGANTIIAANATKKIKVLSYTLVADGAVTAKWQSAATDLTGAMSFAANGGISTPVGAPGFGWLMETAVNEALRLNLGGAVGVRGNISYFLEA